MEKPTAAKKMKVTLDRRVDGTLKDRDWIIMIQQSRLSWKGKFRPNL